MNTPHIVPDLTWTADPVAVELRSVTKDYHTAAGPFRALKEVDLDVKRGEFLAVVGRSGSGKSTLMNMITGIDHPSGGEVHVAGTRVDELPESAMAEWRGRDVGIVFAVRRVEIDYLLPARFDDALTVDAAVETVSKVALTFRQAIRRAPDRLLSRALVQIVCLDRSSFRPTAIPAEIREKMYAQQ